MRELHRSAWPDRLFIAAVSVPTALAIGVLAWLIGDLVVTAWPRLDVAFLTQVPQRAGRAGGIAPMLVSTALVLAIALATAVPLALAAAVALAHARGRWANAVRGSLDVLAGAPSIVIGLFGLLVFGDWLGLGFSLLSGGLTLAVMVLPVVVRLGESALRAVPDDLTTTAAALGLSRTTTLMRIVLPIAMPGLIAAIALGLGRALAETAALLFTAGASERWPQALSDPGRVLAVHIYELAMNVAGGDAAAAASAIVLVAILALTQGIAVWLMARTQRSTS